MGSDERQKSGKTTSYVYYSEYGIMGVYRIGVRLEGIVWHRSRSLLEYGYWIRSCHRRDYAGNEARGVDCEIYDVHNEADAIIHFCTPENGNYRDSLLPDGRKQLSILYTPWESDAVPEIWDQYVRNS